MWRERRINRKFGAGEMIVIRTWFRELEVCVVFLYSLYCELFLTLLSTKFYKNISSTS